MGFFFVISALPFLGRSSCGKDIVNSYYLRKRMRNMDLTSNFLNNYEHQTVDCHAY